MATPTLSSVVAQMSNLVNSWRTYTTQLRNWLGGTAAGGPSSNGSYPLTDDLGATLLVPSPAAQAARVDGVVNSAQTHATAAGTSAGAAATSELNAATSAATSGLSRDAARDSATLAGVYADNAGNSAAAALSSRNASGTSATAAGTSAAAALTSETNAATSATSAATSAGAAATSASNAATAATQSSGFADDAYASFLSAQALTTGLLTYKGAFDASSGTFPASPAVGAFYKISVSGTIAGTALSVGDQMIYDGTNWEKIDNTESVTSVAGRIGNVVLVTADIDGLQGALDAKALSVSPTFSGTVTLPSATGAMTVVAGTGDNATYTTYNSRIHLHWGLAFSDYADNVTGVYDARAGRWDTKGGYRVNGQDVWHAGNFDPAGKASINLTYTSKDANAITAQGNGTMGTVADPSTNTPTGSWTNAINLCDGQWGFQLAHNFFSEDLHLRSRQSGTFGSWRKLWHDGNLNPQVSAVGGSVALRDLEGNIEVSHLRTPASVGNWMPTQIAIQQGDDKYLRWQTPAQFKANLALASTYVQSGDPGAVPDGSVWMW